VKFSQAREGTWNSREKQLPQRELGGTQKGNVFVIQARLQIDMYQGGTVGNQKMSCETCEIARRAGIS
jgi:hypothetical protein